MPVFLFRLSHSGFRFIRGYCGFFRFIQRFSGFPILVCSDCPIPAYFWFIPGSYCGLSPPRFGVCPCPKIPAIHRWDISRKKKTVHNALILQIPRTEKNEAQPQTQHPQMVVIVSLSASVACCAKGIQAPPGHRVVVPICAHLQGCRRLGNPWREWWIAMLG